MARLAQTLRLDGELGGQLLARLPMALVCVLVVLIGIRGALFVADLAGPVATPEPSTLALVAVGGAVAGSARRLRTRKSA